MEKLLSIRDVAEVLTVKEDTARRIVTNEIGWVQIQRGTKAVKQEDLERFIRRRTRSADFGRRRKNRNSEGWNK